MSIARFKVVASFLLAVLFAMLFWGYLIRGSAIHHADNPAVQGAAGLL
jgi:hypothetical protein